MDGSCSIAEDVPFACKRFRRIRGRILTAEQGLCIPVSPEDDVRVARSDSDGRHTMEGYLWALVIVGGPILLGVAIWLFGDQRRRLTRAERERSEQGARENWGKEEIH
jgi:hypothetical protein